MAENSKIGWTKHTWNPAWGCIKVSKECKYCYAERIIKGRQGGNFRAVRRTQPSSFNWPLKLHKGLTGEEAFTERLVFTCSMSDFFMADVDAFRGDMWDIIRRTPHLIYQILTKRPERIADHLPPDWGTGWDNVWLGTSTGTQEAFNQRVPILAEIPARIKFLSIEPLLEPISIGEKALSFYSMDWIILGGESGNDIGQWRYRPCEIEWIEQIALEARAYSTRIFVKQLGTHQAKARKMSDRKGENVDEFPPSLRLREFPRGYKQPES